MVFLIDLISGGVPPCSPMWGVFTHNGEQGGTVTNKKIFKNFTTSK